MGICGAEKKNMKRRINEGNKKFEAIEPESSNSLNTLSKTEKSKIGNQDNSDINIVEDQLEQLEHDGISTSLLESKINKNESNKNIIKNPAFNNNISQETSCFQNDKKQKNEENPNNEKPDDVSSLSSLPKDDESEEDKNDDGAFPNSFPVNLELVHNQNGKNFDSSQNRNISISNNKRGVEEDISNFVSNIQNIKVDEKIENKPGESNNKDDINNSSNRSSNADNMSKSKCIHFSKEVIISNNVYTQVINSTEINPSKLEKKNNPENSKFFTGNLNNIKEDNIIDNNNDNNHDNNNDNNNENINGNINNDNNDNNANDNDNNNVNYNNNINFNGNINNDINIHGNNNKVNNDNDDNNDNNDNNDNIKDNNDYNINANNNNGINNINNNNNNSYNKNRNNNNNDASSIDYSKIKLIDEYPIQDGSIPQISPKLNIDNYVNNHPNESKINEKDRSTVTNFHLFNYSNTKSELIKQNKFKEYHEKQTLKGHTDRVVSLIQLESGNLVTGSYDCTLRVWDLNKNKCISKKEEIGYIFCLLEFEPKMILTGTSENYIGLWDLNSPINEREFTFIRHTLWVNCLVKCDDRFFASASNDGLIIIWDYYNRKNEYELKGHIDSILSLIKLNDGRLCSGFSDGTINIWDWKKKSIQVELKDPQNGWIKCLYQLKNGLLLTGSDDIKVWKNETCIKTITEHNKCVRAFCQIDDFHFASGSFDHTIKIWDLRDFNNCQTITGHNGSVICLIKIKNNKIASCSNDGTIKIWESEMN